MLLEISTESFKRIINLRTSHALAFLVKYMCINHRRLYIFMTNFFMKDRKLLNLAFEAFLASFRYLFAFSVSKNNLDDFP